MKRSTPSSGLSLPKVNVPLTGSIRRAVNRFETSRHRRKRLEATKANERAPITALPPEILSQIFLFCVANCYDDVGWLVVTRVTHQWREIALGCPPLWANIVFRRKLAPVMLSRAKAAPLTIRVALDDKHFQPKLMRDNIARVGVLDVYGWRPSLETFFLDYVGGVSAPHLTSLSVSNTSGDEMWLDAALFPREKRDGNHPPRQLRLQQCALPWNSPWYSNLTSLHLEDLYSTQGPTMSMLISIIVGSPLLQHLTLINTNAHPDDWTTVLPIELRDLRSIRIYEPAAVCEQILINFAFPSIQSVAVTSCLPCEAPSFVVHPDFCQCYDSLHITMPTDKLLRVRARSYWTDRKLLIDVFRERPRLCVEPVLNSFGHYASHHFACVTSLYVNLPFLEVAVWRTLCQCYNLTTLHVQTMNPKPIFQLLLERAMLCIGVSGVSARRGPLDDALAPYEAPNRGPDGACKQLFPHLELIVLEEIICGPTLGSHPSLTDVLRALLWARRAGQCPIRSLELQQCKNVFKQDLDHFRFLTEKFTWDGAGQNEQDKNDPGYLDIRSFSLDVYEQSKFLL